MTSDSLPRSPGEGSPESLEAFPKLSDAQWARLREYGAPDELEVGETAFAAGDLAYDLIVIDEGSLELVRAAAPNVPEASLITFGPGAFVGEFGLLTGQTTYLTARGGRASAGAPRLPAAVAALDGSRNGAL